MQLGDGALHRCMVASPAFWSLPPCKLAFIAAAGSRSDRVAQAVAIRWMKNTSSISPSVAASPVRPYLKWAGAKTRYLQRINAVLPSGFRIRRLIEPFIGSGAVALNTPADSYLLGDMNADLIAAHQAVVAHPAVFMAELRTLFIDTNNTQERFNHLRNDFNQCKNSWWKAVLFVFLNRHSFNGLVRYNKRGEFNAPFGNYRAPYLPDEQILKFATHFASAEFQLADFRGLLAQAGDGDLVFCDPPYAPLTTTANFVGYTAGGFSHSDQVALADLARAASLRGACVVVCNHDTPYTRELYKHASNIQQFSVMRTMSCRGDSRGPAPELLAVYPPSSHAPASLPSSLGWSDFLHQPHNFRQPHHTESPLPGFCR